MGNLNSCLTYLIATVSDAIFVLTTITFFENLSGREDFYQPIKINFDHRAQNSSSSQRSEGQSNNSLTCLVGGPKQSEKKKKH